MALKISRHAPMSDVPIWTRPKICLIIGSLLVIMLGLILAVFFIFYPFSNTLSLISAHAGRSSI